jgi:hypothetical protein
MRNLNNKLKLTSKIHIDFILPEILLLTLFYLNAKTFNIIA